MPGRFAAASTRRLIAGIAAVVVAAAVVAVILAARSGNSTPASSSGGASTAGAAGGTTSPALGGAASGGAGGAASGAPGATSAGATSPAAGGATGGAPAAAPVARDAITGQLDTVGSNCTSKYPPGQTCDQQFAGRYALVSRPSATVLVRVTEDGTVVATQTYAAAVGAHDYRALVHWRVGAHPHTIVYQAFLDDGGGAVLAATAPQTVSV